MKKTRDLRTFDEFYQFYLGEHLHPMSRRLHFFGTTISLILLATALVTQLWWLIALSLVQGYAFAWAGHFFFEHNKPATFQYPLRSFLADWRMWWEMLTRKITW